MVGSGVWLVAARVASFFFHGRVQHFLEAVCDARRTMVAVVFLQQCFVFRILTLRVACNFFYQQDRSSSAATLYSGGENVG